MSQKKFDPDAMLLELLGQNPQGDTSARARRLVQEARQRRKLISVPEILGHGLEQIESPTILANPEQDDIHSEKMFIPEPVIVPTEVDELDRVSAYKNYRRLREVRERKNMPSVKRAVLGNLLNIKGGGPLQTAIYYVGDTDEEAIPVTIVTIPPPIGIGQPVRPFVRVKWGTRSFTVQADVDMGVGSEFTVMGSIVMAAIGADLAPGTNPVFQSGAMAGFGVWSGTSPVWRTHFYDALVPNTPRTQNVPAYAATLYAVHRSLSTVPIEIQFNDAQGNVLYDFTLAASAFFQFPIPIADDVASITVTNNGAVSVNVRAMFALML